LSRVRAFIRPPSTKTIAYVALFAALFLPPLIPLSDIIGAAAAFRSPPIVYHEAHPVSATIRREEPLVLRVTSDYARACIWRWTFEWTKLSPQGETALARDWAPGKRRLRRESGLSSYSNPGTSWALMNSDYNL
jgi:hypothetical protein